MRFQVPDTGRPGPSRLRPMGAARTRSIVFYALVAAALLVLVTKTQQGFLPAGLARQIGHNSEALLFAGLVAAQLQVLRAIPTRPGRLVFIGIGAAALILGGLWLLDADLSPTLVTLKEPMIGAGMVLAYLAVPHPFRLAPVVSLLVLATVVVFFDTEVVLDQAESLVPLILAPLALDVFDRTLTRPDLPDTPGLRLIWMGILLALVLGSMAIAPWAREDLSNGLRLGIDYSQRAAEAYWGWLLIHFYFGYWLGRRWRTGEPTTDANAAAGVA